jgi:hypothetical protein
VRWSLGIGLTLFIGIEATVQVLAWRASQRLNAAIDACENLPSTPVPRSDFLYGAKPVCDPSQLSTGEEAADSDSGEVLTDKDTADSQPANDSTGHGHIVPPSDVVDAPPSEAISSGSVSTANRDESLVGSKLRLSVMKMLYGSIAILT